MEHKALLNVEEPIAPAALRNPGSHPGENNTSNSGHQAKDGKRAEGQQENRFSTVPHPRWRLPRDWW